MSKIAPGERRRIGLNVWEHRLKTAESALRALGGFTRDDTWTAMVATVGAAKVRADLDKLREQLDAIAATLPK